MTARVTEYLHGTGRAVQDHMAKGEPLCPRCMAHMEARTTTAADLRRRVREVETRARQTAVKRLIAFHRAHFLALYREAIYEMTHSQEK